MCNAYSECIRFWQQGKTPPYLILIKTPWQNVSWKGKLPAKSEIRHLGTKKNRSKTPSKVPASDISSAQSATVVVVAADSSSGTRRKCRAVGGSAIFCCYWSFFLQVVDKEEDVWEEWREEARDETASKRRGGKPSPFFVRPSDNRFPAELSIFIFSVGMAQNINPERAASSNPSKQNDETLINNNNHAVSKRWVSRWDFSFFFSCLVRCEVEYSLRKEKQKKSKFFCWRKMPEAF